MPPSPKTRRRSKKPRQSLSYINIPREILRIIFSDFRARELTQVRLVCKDWKSAAEAPFYRTVVMGAVRKIQDQIAVVKENPWKGSLARTLQIRSQGCWTNIPSVHLAGSIFSGAYPHIETIDVCSRAFGDWEALFSLFPSSQYKLKSISNRNMDYVASSIYYKMALDHRSTLERLTVDNYHISIGNNDLRAVINQLDQFSNLRELTVISRLTDQLNELNGIIYKCNPLRLLEFHFTQAFSLSASDTNWTEKDINTSAIKEIYIGESSYFDYQLANYLVHKFPKAENWYIERSINFDGRIVSSQQAISIFFDQFIRQQHSFHIKFTMQRCLAVQIVNQLLLATDVFEEVYINYDALQTQDSKDLSKVLVHYCSPNRASWSSKTNKPRGRSFVQVSFPAARLKTLDFLNHIKHLQGKCVNMHISRQFLVSPVSGKGVFWGCDLLFIIQANYAIEQLKYKALTIRCTEPFHSRTVDDQENNKKGINQHLKHLELSCQEINQRALYYISMHAPNVHHLKVCSETIYCRANGQSPSEPKMLLVDMPYNDFKLLELQLFGTKNTILHNRWNTRTYEYQPSSKRVRKECCLLNLTLRIYLKIETVFCIQYFRVEIVHKQVIQVSQRSFDHQSAQDKTRIHIKCRTVEELYIDFGGLFYTHLKDVQGNRCLSSVE